MTAHCVFCNREVDPNSRETWRQITGFARPGKAGGSDIALREWKHDGYFAHDFCVRRQQEGVSPAQEALV